MYRRLLVPLILLSVAVLWKIGLGTGVPDHPVAEDPGKGTVPGRISAPVRAQIQHAAPGERIPVQALRYDAPVSREEFLSQHQAIFRDAGVELDPSYLMFSASLTGEQIELLSTMDEVYGIAAPDEYAVPQ